MKAIVEYTNEEYAKMSQTYKELVDKTQGIRCLYGLKKKWGHGSYSFSGYVSEELVKALGRAPTTDEIIMLVDGGFSHFGATCAISGDSFSGRVRTD